MRKRISNKTKDIIKLLVFFGLVLFTFVYLVISIINLVATKVEAVELSEQQQINKFYTEETLKNEMYLLSCWTTIDNMSDEEYCETFFKEEENGQI